MDARASVTVSLSGGDVVTSDCGCGNAVEFDFDAPKFKSTSSTSWSGWRTSVISRGISDQSFSLFKESFSIFLFLEHAWSSFVKVPCSDDNDARRLSGDTLLSMD